ncbi:hypothetical protein M501DRAFT_1000147, partial [Patellaria atrata CBS 101060]
MLEDRQDLQEFVLEIFRAKCSAPTYRLSIIKTITLAHSFNVISYFISDVGSIVIFALIWRLR